MVHTGRNVVPGRYRGVSVTALPGDRRLDEAGLRAHFLGRPAYRRTRFIIARGGGVTALLAVTLDSATELFSPIADLQVLAGPGECAFVHDPEVDTAVPSALAATATRAAPHARAVAVQGRYEHVNFILDPQPLRVVVREVVPPAPPKLVDQACRVLAVAEELPPIELSSEVNDLAELAAAAPAAHYLLPCRGSGGDIVARSGGHIPDPRVSYLDEHPPLADWTLLGCERSRQIHRWFYGADAPTVDFCPKHVPGPSEAGRPTPAPPEAGRPTPAPPAGGLLTKCCLQEEQLDAGHGWVAVPWGSTLEQVREALGRLATQQEPAWAPA